MDFSRQTISRDDSSAVFSKPVVEVFLDPLFSRKIAAQLVVNINGGIYDSLSTESEIWNYPFETAISPHVQDSRYSICYFIPWKDTGYENPEVYTFSMIPASNPIIGFNVAREQVTGNGELSQWNPTLLKFMKPDQFGALVFAGEKNISERMLACFNSEIIAGGLEIQGGNEKLIGEMTQTMLKHKVNQVRKLLGNLNASAKKRFEMRFSSILEQIDRNNSVEASARNLNALLELSLDIETEMFNNLKNEIFNEF